MDVCNRIPESMTPYLCGRSALFLSSLLIFSNMQAACPSMQSQQSARCADTRECRWISRYHEGSASIAGVWVRDFWPIRGGGPKKAPKSGKQQQAKAKKYVEDKTFGLKNKNKSKKVQAFVKTVEAQAKDIAYDRKKAEEKKAKRLAKEAAAAREAELELLYKAAPKANEEKPEEEKTTKDLMEEYEYDVSVQKMGLPIALSGQTTAEQEIEAERSQMKEAGQPTPIDKEWFDEWAARFIAERARENAKKHRATPKALTGREVFETSAQAEMLADDEDADDSWALRRQESEESQGEEHVVGDESGHSEDASTRTKEPSGQGSDDEVEEALGKLKV